MPSSTPDWSALASHNERLVTAPVPPPAAAPGPQGEPPAPAEGKLGSKITGVILQFRG